MAYTPTTWKNGQAPAINATNLNKIEQGILDAITQDRLYNLFLPKVSSFTFTKSVIENKQSTMFSSFYLRVLKVWFGFTPPIATGISTISTLNTVDVPFFSSYGDGAFIPCPLEVRGRVNDSAYNCGAHLELKANSTTSGYIELNWDNLKPNESHDFYGTFAYLTSIIKA